MQTAQDVIGFTLYHPTLGNAVLSRTEKLHFNIIGGRGEHQGIEKNCLGLTHSNKCERCINTTIGLMTYLLQMTLQVPQVHH